MLLNLTVILELELLRNLILKYYESWTDRYLGRLCTYTQK